MGRRGPKPGSPRAGGRKKGTPNKLTADLKTAILGALEAKGGQKYLEQVADRDMRTFCTLLGKVLPLQLQGDGDNPIVSSVNFSAAEELMRRLDQIAKTRGASGGADER